jgi:hypothetical protein
MKSKYVRFASPENRGIFQISFDLVNDYDLLSTEDRNELRSLLDWFIKNLKVPDKFVKTKSKGWYRKDTVALSWFKESATQYIDKARLMKTIVSKYISILETITEHPGYVTYEDDHQLVAIPFKDR